MLRRRSRCRHVDHHAWNERYSTKEQSWSAEPNQFFRAAVEELTPGHALDLGTGEGRNAIWLAERGWAVTAVDFSDVAIEKARTLAESKAVAVTWIVQDLLSYRPEVGAFDLVGLVYIHLAPEQRRHVLTMAAGGLAPGGRLVVVGHDTSNFTAGFGGPQDLSLLFTPDDIVADLHDLQVVRAERVIRRVESPDGQRDAIDALVVAARPT